MEENENVEHENALDLGFSLNFDDEETTQESEAEPLNDEDVTILDEEDDTEEFEESEEELDEESEEEEVENEEEIDDLEVSYTPFVAPLLEEGILWADPEKEYDDSPEGFQEILEDTVNYRFQELVGSLPEDAQRVIEVIKAGESLESALEVFNSFDYESIDLEDVDTQKELTKDYYRDNLGWSDEKIEKRVQMLEDLDELGEEAAEAQRYFVQKTAEEKEAYYTQVQAKQQAALEAQNKEIEEYNQLINEVQGFKGLEFTSNRQREEFRSYCFDKGEDGLTAYERDTIKSEDKLAQAFYMFNNFGFETIQRQATTKSSVAQKKILARLGQKDKNAVSNRSHADKQVKPKGDFYIPPVNNIV